MTPDPSLAEPIPSIPTAVSPRQTGKQTSEAPNQDHQPIGDVDPPATFKQKIAMLLAF